jgi:hypothetical protein
MNTVEIPATDWASFLTSFSRSHAGWLVRVELLSPVKGAQLEFIDRPLAALELVEPKMIALRVNDPEGQLVTREVTAPTEVWLLQTDEGADEALEIRCADSATLLTFRSTMPAEYVDGVADMR